MNIGDKIPSTGLAIYQTPNDLLESSSVKWLDRLFDRPGIKTSFNIGDKKPDVDGTFEILNNARFDGRFEVQIKTYNIKSSKNKPQYQCDVKYLNYALKNRISCILLFVVDSQNNRALWKYLTESYIKSLNIKPNQKKITIKFMEDEYVDFNNLNQCISRWHSYFQIKNNGIYFDNCSFEESLQKVAELEKYFDNIQLSTLDKNDITTIQKFIDRFNYLLDGDFSFIKSFYYPQMWKMAIAIGAYTQTSLGYMLYPIFWGSNDLLLKTIKLDNFSDLVKPSLGYNFISAQINESQNPIMSGEPDLIMGHIEKKIKEIIERKKFLFLTTEIAVEHIFDSLKEHYRFWRINQGDTIQLMDLKEYLENNHSASISNQTRQISSSNLSNISTLYQCVTYLLENNIKEIRRIYQILPNDSDSQYAEYLFKKTETIYSIIPTTFEAYMYFTFPSLQKKITFWDGYDLVSVNFLEVKNKFFIIIHYFKTDNSNSSKPHLLITREFKHELYKEFSFKGYYNHDYFKTKYSYNGINYRLHLVHGDEIHHVKNKFSIFHILYYYLARRFNNYLGPKNQISSLSYI